MPNHITNRLIIEGKEDEVKKVFDFIKSDKNDEDGAPIYIDFNKIMPMSSDLDVPSSSEGEDGKKYLLGLSGNIFQREAYQRSEHYQRMETLKNEAPERFERCLELGRKYLHNIAEYGNEDWYGWRIANWGTKWNAYDIHLEDWNVLYFNTAWSGVPKLISMLAVMFPEVTIKYDFADENTGYNVGSYIMRGEEVEDNSPADDSAEAWAIVFELSVASIEDYEEQPDGSYSYKEED